MANLALAGAFFLFIHLIISGTRIRDRLVATMGERVYMGLFSLASIGGIFWLAAAYNQALLGDNPVLWIAPAGLIHSGGLIILIAFLLAVTGLLTPNPTAAMAGDLLKSGDPATGINRVTRHPFLWGALIWSAFHLAVNGDLASVLFFGTFLVLTVFGTRSIDAKRKRAYGEDWEKFAKVTSNIPFLAILMRRNSLKLGEIGIWRPLAGVIAFGAVFYFHLWLFGVSPTGTYPDWMPR